MGQWLNRIHLRGKLAFILIAGFFLPMLILAVFTISRLTVSNREVRLQEMQRVIDEERSRIDAYFSQAVAFSLDMITDATLNEVLDAEYASPYDFLIAYQDIIQSKMEVNPVYSSISNMVVYTDNPTLLPGKFISRMDSVDYLFDEDVNSVSLWAVSDRDFFLRVSAGNRQKRLDADISLVRKMNFISYSQNYHRILRISMNLPVLEAELADSEPFTDVLLMNDANQILLPSARLTSADEAQRSFRPEDVRGDQETMEIRLSTCPFLRLVGVYPRNVMTKKFSGILMQYVVFSVLLAVLGLVLAGLMTKNITRRLQVIGRHAKEIAGGRFATLDESRMGGDEVGMLARDIDQMSQQLETYIQKEYLNELQHAQLEQEKATAELHALQSQVNPHFMFNALEAIRLKAKARGEKETARMITYMSRMFRRLLDWHDDLIPLREELAFIKEFLAIQEYRYDHAYSFEVQADEQLMDNYIPKMLIQPLVENACVHGIWTDDGVKGAGLYITRKGEFMQVIVADHGEGMSEERLADIKRLLKEGNNSMHSVGLNNVQARCRLYYGDRAQMDVESEKNRGTVFTLLVPICWEKEDFHVSGHDRGR